jgi:hypothetical protein
MLLNNTISPANSTHWRCSRLCTCIARSTFCSPELGAFPLKVAIQHIKLLIVSVDVSHLPTGIVQSFIGNFQFLQGAFVLQLPLTNHGCLDGHIPLDPINDDLKLLIHASFLTEVILGLGKTWVEVGEAEHAIAAAGAFKE